MLGDKLSDLFEGLSSQFFEQSSLCDVHCYSSSNGVQFDSLTKCHSVILSAALFSHWETFLFNDETKDDEDKFVVFLPLEVCSRKLQEFLSDLYSASKEFRDISIPRNLIESLNILALIDSNSNSECLSHKRSLSPQSEPLKWKKTKIITEISNYEEEEKNEEKDSNEKKKKKTMKRNQQISFETSRLKNPQSYDCLECDSQFDDFEIFIRHKNAHDLTTSELDSQEYLSQGSDNHISRKVKRHEESHEENEEEENEEFAEPSSASYICDVCGIIKDSVSGLKYHSRIHEKFSCKDCSQVITGVNAYRTHIERTHEPNVNCSHCSKTFSTRKDAKAHEERTHGIEGNEFIPCPKCDKVLKHKKEFRRHLNYIHPNCEPVVCEVCGMECSGPDMLKNHIKKKHVYNDPFYKSPFDPLLCTICFKLTHNEEWLKMHTELLHPPTVTYSVPCDSCDKFFPSSENLREHQSVEHLNDRPHACSSGCSLSFNTLAELEYHAFYEHKIGDNPLSECNYCQKKYIHSKALKDHILRIHVGGNYICDICGKRFLNKTFLSRHVQGSHLKEVKFSCTFEGCGRVFHVERYLQKHLELVHLVGAEIKEHNCPECGKSYKNSKYLTDHMKHKHTREEDKKYKCTYCDKKFALLSRQHYHERSAHLETKKYSCGVSGCDYGSAHPAGVKAHLFHRHGIGSLKGKNEKAACEHCGKEYSDVYARNKHVALYHKAGDTHPHKCKFCGKGFRRLIQKDGHEMALHIKEEPYKCEICGKGFNRKPSLYKHQKKNHNTVSQRTILKNTAIRFDGILPEQEAKMDLIIKNEIAMM